MELMPLIKSAEYDDVEGEFKALFLSLYKQYLDTQVSEVAMYGMPQIAGIDLIERYLSGDGLAVMASTTEERLRYLFHAWRFRNPQRGTAFLAAYLNTLFGPVFTIEQLWCKKDGVYPVDVLDRNEIAAEGGDTDDYFLTSRLRVDVETQRLPERVVNASKTALAARFVLEMRAAKRIGLQMAVSLFGYGAPIGRMSGVSRLTPREVHSGITVGVCLQPIDSGVVVARTAGESQFRNRDVYAVSTVGAGMYAVVTGDSAKLIMAEGIQVIREPVVDSQVMTGLASQPGAATFVYSSIPRVDMQTYPK